MENQPPKKVGLLCEDANAVEVRDADGKSRVEKTDDRERRINELADPANKSGKTYVHGKRDR